MRIQQIINNKGNYISALETLKNDDGTIEEIISMFHAAFIDDIKAGLGLKVHEGEELVIFNEVKKLFRQAKRNKRRN